jgi:hypothetical protein
VKPVVESGQTNICSVGFLLRMVWNKEMLYGHYFSTLL